MEQYYYLLIDLACLSIPLIASFHPRIQFYKEWKHFLPAMLIVALFFLLWDEWFTAMGVWGFNERYLMGLSIGHLPLEEILFFICIPYACVFTYYVIKHVLQWNPLSNVERIPIFILLIVSIVLTITFREQYYTSITFLLLGLALIGYLLTQLENVGYVLMSYCLILPFFFISNGLLTGFGIEEQIVWYQDEENMNIRLATIPFEDAFYGFLLILMNIELYEYFKRINWIKA